MERLEKIVFLYSLTDFAKLSALDVNRALNMPLGPAVLNKIAEILVSLRRTHGN